jgi:hypothetical protein
LPINYHNEPSNQFAKPPKRWIVFLVNVVNVKP